MSSISEKKINNETKIEVIYPNILNRNIKKGNKIYKLKDSFLSIPITEKENQLEEKKIDLNNNIIESDTKKKKTKKIKRKKKKSLTINFKYKIKTSVDSNNKKHHKKFKIKKYSKSLPKLKYIKRIKDKNISSVNIVKIEDYTRRDFISNSIKKLIKYKKEFKNQNNSNEKIDLNSPTRTFNFRNKINNIINNKKFYIKKKKDVCMTPKIILNQGGNEVDSMNGGHSNNYTTKYLIEKALKYNNSFEGKIGEGIDSSIKVNIRGKKNTVSASINKTNPNEEKTNNNEVKNDDKNDIKIIENKNEIKEENLNKNDNNNDYISRRKIFSNLLKSRTKYHFNDIYKKEEIEKRFVRIRKTYQENEFNQSLQNMKTYIYLILPGNASYLVKNCMKHRINWREPFSSVTSLFNFKWQQLSYGIDYNSLGAIRNTKQIVNHFENHYFITNKANMFINLMDYCEKRKISVFKFVPFTIIFQFKDKVDFDNNNDIVKSESKRLEELKFFINNSNKHIVNYDDIGKFYQDQKYKEDQIKREKFNNQRIKKLKKKLKIDEGISSNNVENDDINNIINSKYESDIKVYSDFFPKIKLINKNSNIIKDKDGNLIDEEIKEKEKENEKNQKYIGKSTLVEIPNTHNSGKNMWIIKAINLNRGKCIRIVNSFEEIEKVIKKFKEGVKYSFTETDIALPINENAKINNNNINENFDINDKQNEEEKNSINNKEIKEKIYYCSRILIQKYIERPLLYRGRKCDIRIWVLLTQSMKVYVFKEGHLKTCSVEFNINCNNAFIHITNYSFQKYNNNFQKFEKGNEVPFFEFQKFIDESYSNKNYNLKKDLMDKAKEIISLSMKSVKDKINKNNRNHQFEIFGYDFMLDEDFNLFLIEINTNPGLEESSPWIKIIVPRMLDDALRLTLDKLFEPKYDFNLNHKNMEDLENLENVFNNLQNNIDPNTIDKNQNTKIILDKKDNQNKLLIKNKNYISPFPVPGYSSDENLWDFICDLNEKDSNDDFLDTKSNENTKETLTNGIKSFDRKKNKSKEKSK